MLTSGLVMSLVRQTNKQQGSKTETGRKKPPAPRTSGLRGFASGRRTSSIGWRGSRGPRLRTCGRFGSAFFLRRRNLFHDGGGTVFAHLAVGIVNPALCQRIFATAGAGFGVEFVQRSIALLGSESARVHA